METFPKMLKFGRGSRGQGRSVRILLKMLTTLDMILAGGQLGPRSQNAHNFGHSPSRQGFPGLIYVQEINILFFLILSFSFGPIANWKLAAIDIPLPARLHWLTLLPE
jgi:hypothetical protein